MTPPDDDKPDASAKPDPTVKQLLERDRDKPLTEVIDAATAAELERWFGLPSFQQLEEEPPPEKPEDPERVAIRARRDAALANVDPRLMAAIDARFELAWGLLKFDPLRTESKVDLEMPLFKEQLADRLHANTEPREIERPEDIDEELKDQTPQALLRDLHRTVSYFDKLFEIVDAAAEQTLDIVAEVRAAMKADWRLPSLGDPPSVAFGKLSAQLRAERGIPWATLPKRVKLVNRRVAE